MDYFSARFLLGVPVVAVFLVGWFWLNLHEGVDSFQRDEFGLEESD
jgi:hypothetical protein